MGSKRPSVKQHTAYLPIPVEVHRSIVLKRAVLLSHWAMLWMIGTSSVSDSRS